MYGARTKNISEEQWWLTVRVKEATAQIGMIAEQEPSTLHKKAISLSNEYKGTPVEPKKVHVQLHTELVCLWAHTTLSCTANNDKLR